MAMLDTVRGRVGAAPTTMRVRTPLLDGIGHVLPREAPDVGVAALVRHFGRG